MMSPKPQRIEIIFQKKSYEVDVTNPQDTLHEIVTDLYQNIIRTDLSFISRTYADLMIRGRFYTLYDPTGQPVFHLTGPPEHSRYTISF